MPDIRDQFDGAMFEIYRRAKAEADYPANIFLNMLTKNGGLATAKRSSTRPSRRTVTPRCTSGTGWI